MKDAFDFALRVFIKQGIWIAGAAWLVAVGSHVIFMQTDWAGKSNEEVPVVIKRRIIIGVVMFVVGIIVALIPIK